MLTTTLACATALFLRVGFETLCRGSEVAALRAEDLQPGPSGGMSLLVRMGKTDPNGRGRTVVLSTSTTEIVQAWLIASRISHGLMFPRIDRSGASAGALTASGITKLLRKRATTAGLSHNLVPRLSSHSLRVGGAQQLTMMDRNLAQIMRAGGWRSIGTVSRYIESAELSVWEDGPAHLSFPPPTHGAPRTKGWA